MTNVYNNKYNNYHMYAYYTLNDKHDMYSIPLHKNKRKFILSLPRYYRFMNPTINITMISLDDNTLYGLSESYFYFMNKCKFSLNDSLLDEMEIYIVCDI